MLNQIDALLPQTQCRKCGYPSCKQYAQAIVTHEADINQCPPGGAAGIQKLADLLGRPVKPLSAQHGIEKPRELALVNEALCIGCTLCIQACPVDAIIGAAKQMHTVINSLCTGCELCVAPCPVDCISMVAANDTQPQFSAEEARGRFEFHLLRLDKSKTKKDLVSAENNANDASKSPVPCGSSGTSANASPALSSEERKKALVTAAIERARMRRAE